MSLQSTDPIADMLTRIRNAVLVNKHEVRMPNSKMKQTVATELKNAGYVKAVTVEKGTPRDELVILINEQGENSVISEITRLSKPGRRVYAGADDIPRIKSGRGIILISTSKGIMTGHAARKARLGGELHHVFDAFFGVQPLGRDGRQRDPLAQPLDRLGMLLGDLVVNGLQLGGGRGEGSGQNQIEHSGGSYALNAAARSSNPCSMSDAASTMLDLQTRLGGLRGSL